MLYFFSLIDFRTLTTALFLPVNDNKGQAKTAEKAAAKKDAAAKAAAAIASRADGSQPLPKEERKERGRITPYKARDLVPLIRNAVSKNPSL